MQRIFIPAITAFSRRLKWFVRHGRPNCRAITSDSRLSYWETKWGRRKLLIVYRSSRSYVQHIHGQNFYSSDYCFFSPPDVVRPACDGHIAPQLRAIRGCHTGKRSEQAKIFWKFTNPAEDVYRISTPLNFFSNDNPFISPHEVVRPAPYGQIAVITTDSTP